MNYVCLNGNIVSADQPLLTANNRGYRYGDGLFETLKIKNNRIVFEKWHFERLLNGLQLIDLPLPPAINAAKLASDIFQLCERNDCSQSARVRLSVNRGNGLIAGPNQPQYIIECETLHNEDWNEHGYAIDVYRAAKKSCDQFSNLKSANYLPYVMAARFAKDRQLHDALVMNMYERIADSSIANVFIVKGKKLFTPALAEGCVAGITRRWVIKKFGAIETSLIVEDILTADEIFLTNAIKGIRQVGQFSDKFYDTKVSKTIHEKLWDEIESGVEV